MDPMPARRRPACLFALVAAVACENQSGGGSGTESSGGGTGSSSTTDTATEGMEGPLGDLRPRWILRDKDGVAVRAIVEPHCPDEEDCRIPDVGAPPTFSCVHVTTFEDRYVGLVYGVADGSPLSCYPKENFPSLLEACSAEPDCSGPYFYAGAEGFFSDRPDAVRTVYRKGDELFYVASSQPAEQDCFFRDVVDGCFKYAQPLVVYPIVPVPPEYVELLAAGAPYTLAAAYD